MRAALRQAPRRRPADSPVEAVDQRADQLRRGAAARPLVGALDVVLDEVVRVVGEGVDVEVVELDVRHDAALDNRLDHRLEHWRQHHRPRDVFDELHHRDDDGVLRVRLKHVPRRVGQLRHRGANLLVLLDVRRQQREGAQLHVRERSRVVRLLDVGAAQAEQPRVVSPAPTSR